MYYFGAQGLGAVEEFTQMLVPIAISVLQKVALVQELPRYSEQFLEIVTMFGEPLEGLCLCNEVTDEVCLATETMDISCSPTHVLKIANSSMQVDEAGFPAPKLGDIACIPKGIKDRTSLDVEVVETWTMLPKIAAVTMLPIIMTMQHSDVQIDDSFA